MTEIQLRNKVVSVMKSWVGLKEADGGHKKILDIYNGHTPLARGYKVKTTDAWCAATVSAAFIKAGLTDIAPTECSCAKMIELYKAKGRWVENDAYVPTPGDLIMYDWQDTGKGDNRGAPDHVGMVISVTGNTMRVIEGNKNEAVGYRTMSVNGRYIRGYCVPDYASKATSPIKRVAAASSFDKSYEKTYTVTASSLNMRYGPGTDREVIKTLPKGSKVVCYGYYTKIGATVWLLVKDRDDTVGFCSKKYLV